MYSLSLSLSLSQDFDSSYGSSATTCDFTPVLLVPTTSMPTTEKGVAAIIAGSVIGSSIVLLLLGVVFVLLVTHISRHRRTKNSHGNDLDLSVNLINPVYVPVGKMYNNRFFPPSFDGGSFRTMIVWSNRYWEQNT